jgi:Domain of unknown function (DUF4160)
MPVIFRAGGLRYVIYLDDHHPAHIHLIGDGEAKILLIPEVKLVWQKGFSKRDVQKALDVVKQNQTGFLTQWEVIHGKFE